MTIDQFHKKFSLSDVARRLGISGFPEGPGKMCSPIREGDENPSFSIWQGRAGGFLWTDHRTKETGDGLKLIERIRGCSTKAALALAREWAGPTSPPQSPGKLVKIYSYHDQDGKLAHQTLRFEPKNFRQRQPAKEGMAVGGKIARCDKTGAWWLWTLANCETYLYKLPEILARPLDPVYLCEGEKDAEALVDLGLLGTTAPMGAGRWRSSYAESIAKRSVVIVPDSDDVGLSHGAAAAQSLVNSGCSVRIVDWRRLWPAAPEGKFDLSDYLGAMGTIL